MRRRHVRRIRQVDIDFLCLSVFGQRALPDAMAERIALRRELARGLAEYAANVDRAAGRRLEVPEESVEALIAVG